MKQGSASRTVAEWKTEPKANKANPGGVDMLGQATAFKKRPVIDGRGYEAPHAEGRTVHKSGSQRRY